MKTIRNTRSGHEYRLLRTAQDTGGERLEMEVRYPPASDEPPAHYHPRQSEHFQVLTGEVTVRLGNELRVLGPGDVLDLPPSTVHSMWNAGDQPALVHWTVTPALRTEQLFETLAELANSGRTNAAGVPRLLQVSLTMLRYAREFRLASPAFPVQVMAFGLLTPIALVLGYRASRLRSHPNRRPR